MHKKHKIVQVFIEFLFCLIKNMYICTAKLTTNLYLLIKNLKSYV
jgi:hypothetical protein